MKKTFIVDDGLEKSYIQLDPSLIEKNDSHRAVILFYHEDELKAVPSYLVKRLDLSECRVFLFNFSADELLKETKKNVSQISRQGYIFQQFIEYINKVYGIESQDISILSFAQSSLVIAAWIIDYASKVSSVTFVAPAIFTSRREMMKTGLCNIINNRGGNKQESKDGPAIAIENKTSSLKRNACRNINDIIYSSRRIIRDAFSYQTPTFVVFLEKDSGQISASQRKFYASIASEIKETVILPPSAINNSGVDNNIFYDRITKFILDRFSETYVPASLFNLYLKGATKDEYEKLRRDETDPLKKCYWKAVKKFMHSVGRLSTGIRTGMDNGFDSGVSLEYMYRNEPEGKTLIGKFLDRLYLNNNACRSLRVREKNVEAFIAIATKNLAAEGKQIRLLDIAAGCGRYIFNMLRRMNQPLDHALMRDFDNANVLSGRKKIQDLRLSEKATFEQGDAFSPDDLATIPRDRTLTIVSGFYELFSDNALVLASLKGISEATEEGGYLIYTTKLWNPMAAFAARVLPSLNKGEYWVLRRRTQLEIDQLVNQAGFVKVAQRIDPFGRFSVALAKKMR